MKRVFTIILAIALVLSYSAPAFAGTSENFDSGEALQMIGMINGTGQGLAAGQALSRAECYVVMIRMLGEEKYAYDFESDRCGFTDIEGTWYEHYAKYAFAKGLTRGIGNNKFGGDLYANDAQLATVCLRALGYTESKSGAEGDFSFSTAKDFARGVGLIQSAGAAQDASRADALNIMWNALNTRLKGENRTMADRLIDKGVVNADLMLLARGVAYLGSGDGSEDVLDTEKRSVASTGGAGSGSGNSGPGGKGVLNPSGSIEPGSGSDDASEIISAYDAGDPVQQAQSNLDRKLVAEDAAKKAVEAAERALAQAADAASKRNARVALDVAREAAKKAQEERSAAEAELARVVAIEQERIAEQERVAEEERLRLEREEAERLAREAEEAQREAERKAAEAAEAEEAARKAAEEEAARLAEEARRAAEEAEAARKAEEAERERIQAERKAAEEAERQRLEAERQALEEAERKLAEEVQKATEEAQKAAEQEAARQSEADETRVTNKELPPINF